MDWHVASCNPECGFANATLSIAGAWICRETFFPGMPTGPNLLPSERPSLP